jgi:hypothetical protein
LSFPDPIPSRRRRFRWLLAAGILALILLETHLLTRVTWDAILTAPVRVQAVDAATGSPIPGASVQAFDRNRAVVRINPPTQTDDAGNATVKIFAAGAGQRSMIYESATAAASGSRIQCTAPGYIQQELALVDTAHFGRFLFIPFGSPKFDVRVPMRRNSPR